MGPTGCIGSPRFPSLHSRRKGKDVEIDGEDVINHDKRTRRGQVDPLSVSSDVQCR